MDSSRGFRKPSPNDRSQAKNLMSYKYKKINYFEVNPSGFNNEFF